MFMINFLRSLSCDNKIAALSQKQPIKSGSDARGSEPLFISCAIFDLLPHHLLTLLLIGGRRLDNAKALHKGDTLLLSPGVVRFLAVHVLIGQYEERVCAHFRLQRRAPDAGSKPSSGGQSRFQRGP